MGPEELNVTLDLGYGDDFWVSRDSVSVISHIGSECPEPGPYKWCWLPTCYTRFGASGSEVGSRHQKQNREGSKAQSGQYMASWARPLQFSSV